MATTVENPFQAEAGTTAISPQSALLPVEEDLPRIVCWSKLQLLCTFLQVDFKLATMNQTLMVITDSVRL